MNIKGFFPNIFGVKDVRTVDKTGRLLKSDEAHDRDANGQQAFDDTREQHEPMTDEQLNAAMEQLRNLPVAKEHKWTIHLMESEEGRFVIVKDNLGSMIRKIPESELWTLPRDSSSKGQLLKKSA